MLKVFLHHFLLIVSCIYCVVWYCAITVCCQQLMLVVFLKIVQCKPLIHYCQS